MHSAIVFAALFAMAAAGGLPSTGLGGIPTPFGTITGVADTPEVSAAKAQHFALQAAARTGVVAATPYGAVLRHGFSGGIPQPDGSVITNVADTPEVVAAKNLHFAAQAQARGAVVGVAPVAVAAGYAAPAVVRAAVPAFGYAAAPAFAGYAHAGYAAPVFSPYGGPIAGIPTAHGVITGVADTPEVVAAKAQHFAAHAQALARGG